MQLSSLSGTNYLTTYVRYPTNLLNQLGLLFAYCTYIHPLRDFPGPALAKLTNLYGAFYALRMDIHLRIYQDHLKYGALLSRTVIYNSKLTVIYRPSHTPRPK